MKEQPPPRTLPSAASSADCRPIPATHVTIAVHGTRTVLLDSIAGRFFGLDEVGARIWSLMSSGLTRNEIVERLVEEYDSNPETIAMDVDRLLTDLRSKKLLEDQ
jgi:hypothetical protein